MNHIHDNDKNILRSLAGKYSEIANLEVQSQRIDRYYKTISMENPRPVVLIDEVPWGEIDDESLKNRCEDENLWWLETSLRKALYQWEHFQVDTVIPSTFRIGKKTTSTGIGIDVVEKRIESQTGTYAAAHEYTDQLKTEADVDRLHVPEISYDKAGTEAAVETAEEIFSGLMPVEVAGTTFSYNIWDRIAVYRGVDNLLMDLAAKPDLMHRTAAKFAEIGAAMVRQNLELGLFDTAPMILHCTPASAKELPAEDFTGEVRLKDLWGRCAAQIFAAVSPEMHDEFDLKYNQELFGEFGLLYYGCCEPMDTKIDILRNRFKNLRKISITPWADPEVAARNIGSDYVLAAKPNPAFVNSPTFNPKPVEDEITRFLDASRKYGTTCEFVLKDISTIAKNPLNLTQWAATVSGVIDRYY